MDLVDYTPRPIKQSIPNANQSTITTEIESKRRKRASKDPTPIIHPTSPDNMVDIDTSQLQPLHGSSSVTASSVIIPIYTQTYTELFTKSIHERSTVATFMMNNEEVRQNCKSWMRLSLNSMMQYADYVTRIAGEIAQYDVPDFGAYDFGQVPDNWMSKIGAFQSPNGMNFQPYLNEKGVITNALLEALITEAKPFKRNYWLNTWALFNDDPVDIDYFRLVDTTEHERKEFERQALRFVKLVFNISKPNINIKDFHVRSLNGSPNLLLTVHKRNDLPDQYTVQSPFCFEGSAASEAVYFGHGLLPPGVDSDGNYRLSVSDRPAFTTEIISDKNYHSVP